MAQAWDVCARLAKTLPKCSGWVGLAVAEREAHAWVTVRAVTTLLVETEKIKQVLYKPAVLNPFQCHETENSLEVWLHAAFGQNFNLRYLMFQTVFLSFFFFLSVRNLITCLCWAISVRISNFFSACSTVAVCGDDDSHLQIISAFVPICTAEKDGSKQKVLSNRCMQNNPLANKMTQKIQSFKKILVICSPW